MAEEQPAYAVEMVRVEDLRDHARNYRAHPDDQLQHVMQSIRENGIYRNVVLARDGTILAGHCVVLAALQMGLKAVPAVRLDIDPDSVQAMKVLVGDNEIARMGLKDQVALELALREVAETSGLLGTGYDEMMLAALAFVNRPANPAAGQDAKAEWEGMPEFTVGEDRITLVVEFSGDEAKVAFGDLIGVVMEEKTVSIWWPEEARNAAKALKFRSE